MLVASGLKPRIHLRAVIAALAALGHPNLFKIDVAEAEQRVFVVRARSFADYVRSG
jgi:hypothetical protein